MLQGDPWRGDVLNLQLDGPQVCQKGRYDKDCIFFSLILALIVSSFFFLTFISLLDFTSENALPYFFSSGTHNSRMHVVACIVFFIHTCVFFCVLFEFNYFYHPKPLVLLSAYTSSIQSSVNMIMTINCEVNCIFS